MPVLAVTAESLISSPQKFKEMPLGLTRTNDSGPSMPKEFRVMDCRATVVEPAEIRVLAETPEHAARLAIGEDLIRGGGAGRPKKLRARVYCGAGPTLTMVRLFAKTHKSRNTVSEIQLTAGAIDLLRALAKETGIATLDTAEIQPLWDDRFDMSSHAGTHIICA